jgi:uncharacterized protein
MTEFPSQIDRWEVISELGSGDFATVFKVQSGSQEAALKLCPSDNDAARQRLRLEEAALRQLDNPHIPRLLDAGESDSRPYLVMTLARGRTLRDAIEERQECGGTHGYVETMEILAKILHAVRHVHDAGFVHRDIKDANVIAGPAGTSVTLIDFGFCKPIGQRGTRLDDSFWRAGAPRFSPPTKLDNPGLALPAHDIFAVGVIGYRLLTNEYPWSVDHDHVGALRELELHSRPVPVAERNSYVLPRVSDLIARLLQVNDDDRPDAEGALGEIKELLSFVTSSPRKIIRGPSRPIYPHVKRDPIYGDVRLTEYEWEIYTTPEMQRLRRIKQLGLTHHVYDSAEHSRLAHSVGCVARVEQALRTIEDQEGVRVDEELRLQTRLYALVHDVTHIPFGHTLEDEFNFFPNHEDNRPRIERIIFSRNSTLGHSLEKREEGRAVLKLFQVDAHNRAGAVVDLVSGQTGADVLDYVDRDALFCGLDHRVDSAIFRQLRLHQIPRSTDRRVVSMVNDEYGVRVDREFAVESLLEVRYALFLKVYTHKHKIAVSSLLAKGLTDAVFPSSGRPTLGEESFEQLGMGDDALLDRMRQSRREAARWAADLLLSGRRPVGVYRARLLEGEDPSDSSYEDRRKELKEKGLFTPRERSELEAQIANRARLEPRQVMIYCPHKAPGYQRAEHWVTHSRNAAPTLFPSARAIARRHLALWQLWVFVTDDCDARERSVVADEAQQQFGFRNVIDLDLPQARPF